MPLDDPYDDVIGFVCIPRPMDLSASGNASLLKLQQIFVEVPQRVGFDIVPGTAKLLPISQFADHLGPFCSDYVRRMPNVVPDLCVRHELSGSGRKLRCFSRMSDPDTQLRSPE